jgi:hypothetical protein
VVGEGWEDKSHKAIRVTAAPRRRCDLTSDNMWL